MSDSSNDQPTNAPQQHQATPQPTAGSNNTNQRNLLNTAIINRNPVNFGNYEGLFMHYLYVNLTMRYARFFKPNIRRLIEFLALLNAIFMFALLIYIHVTFVKADNNCLSHVEDIWPRNGILRVQVTRNSSHPKHKLYFAQKPFLPTTLSVDSNDNHVHIKQSIELSLRDLLSIWGRRRKGIAASAGDFTFYDRRQLAYWSLFLYKDMSPVMPASFKSYLEARVAKTLRTASIEMHSKTPTYEYEELNEQFQNYEMTVGQMNLEASDVRDYYAIEFSTEFGFLRLSSEARARLKIPTLVINLEADNDECFGTSFKKVLLQSFLGYDDFIMTSIKKLAEKGQNHGFLRNLVTGEYFRFETVWNNQISSLIAFATMLIFTVVVTMLLRYSYHQIFIAMVEIVRMVDANTQRLIFPIGPGPLFTIILALVGMEEIMLEFFHDSSIAFYVIIIIWVADQFDLVCMNALISRRYWIRFFFLYHFAFYSYHHRYNGRFSKLALITSWLFIQHSMIYFLHHFELPTIQRQLEIFEPPQTRRPSMARGGGMNRMPTTTPSSSAATSSSSTTSNSSDEPSTSNDNVNQTPPGSSREQSNLTWSVEYLISLTMKYVHRLRELVHRIRLIRHMRVFNSRRSILLWIGLLLINIKLVFVCYTLATTGLTPRFEYFRMNEQAV